MFPSRSNARMGGAAMQHSAPPSTAPASPPVRLPRWTIQITSESSTHMPMELPSSQAFGIGFGQNGSTWNIGACALWASTLFWSCP